MTQAMTADVIVDRIVPSRGTALLVKRTVLVVVGVAALALAAKVQVPVWPSPVPVTLGTFAVLTIGAAYGVRLGLLTILCYMAVGAAGFDVFAGSSAEKFGPAYMMGTTGGYLVGYVLATVALGVLARAGWDRSVPFMAMAMLIGSVLVYLPGVAWLYVLIDGGLFKPEVYATVWEQTLAWGVTPYLVGDAMKLALAALVLPGVWKLIGSARS